MRRSLLTMALLGGALTVAHADTFSFTSTDGTLDVTGSISGAPFFTEPTNGGAIYQTSITANGTTIGSYVGLFNPVLSAGAGLPPLDFSFYVQSDDYLYGGEQVYSGMPADPVLVPGIYDLTGYVPVLNGQGDVTGYTVSEGGTLVIAAPSPTPEPSSFILLGSGVLSLAAVARERRRRC
jgi:PEP-CTERM motif